MYIVDVDSQERETQAIRLLLTSPWRDDLLVPFGFDALTWVVVEAQKHILTPEIVGDVDILVGNLAFKDWTQYSEALTKIQSEYPQYPPNLRTFLAGKIVAEADGIEWPPRPSHLAGIEVKVSYFTDKPRATKSSPEKVNGIRNQIDWLEAMGLDQFALLDVVGNEPSDDESGAWFGALARAEKSRSAMDDILKCRLAEDSAAGQFVWSIGSVVGGDEGMRGAGGLHMLRSPNLNPRLAVKHPDVVRNRRAILDHIPRLLAAAAAPRYFPVVLIDCRKCRAVHYLNDPHCTWNCREGH